MPAPGFSQSSGQVDIQELSQDLRCPANGYSATKSRLVEMRSSLRVVVAKVAQNRRFHQDFRSFITHKIYNAITIGAMPPAAILGKNRASCTFSGNILSTGVMATFRRNLATRVRCRLSGRRIGRAGNRPSQQHAPIVVVTIQTY